MVSITHQEVRKTLPSATSTDAPRFVGKTAIVVGASANVGKALSALLARYFARIAHSEDIAGQEVSVALNTRPGPTALSHAEGHRHLIRRFGRFPHRNPLLLRQTTMTE